MRNTRAVRNPTVTLYKNPLMFRHLRIFFLVLNVKQDLLTANLNPIIKWCDVVFNIKVIPRSPCFSYTISV